MNTTQWEYAWVRRARGIKGSWTGVYPEAGPWEPDIQADVRQAGLDGWELVTVVTHSNWAGQGAGFTSEEVYIFKRPKVQPDEPDTSPATP